MSTKLTEAKQMMGKTWRRLQDAAALERPGRNEVALRVDKSTLLILAVIVGGLVYLSQSSPVKDVQKGAQQVVKTVSEVAQKMPDIATVDAKLLAQEQINLNIPETRIHPTAFRRPYQGKVLGYKVDGFIQQQDCLRLKYGAANFVKITPVEGDDPQNFVPVTLADGTQAQARKVKVTVDPSLEGGKSPIAINSIDLAKGMTIETQRGLLSLVDNAQNAVQILRERGGGQVPGICKLPLTDQVQTKVFSGAITSDEVINSLNKPSEQGTLDALGVYFRQNPLIADVEFLPLAPVTAENVESCVPQQFDFRALRALASQYLQDFKACSLAK